MSAIRTAPLFTLRLKAGTPQPLGKTPAGERRVVEVTGGGFEGERMSGVVLPGGSDWIMARPDGSLRLDVRISLKTNDGAIIGMTYNGYRHGSAAVLERLGRGEAVDPSDYYFRIAPFFETGAAKYAWLNNIIAIGTGRRPPEGPVYEVFEVL